MGSYCRVQVQKKVAGIGCRAFCTLDFVIIFHFVQIFANVSMTHECRTDFFAFEMKKSWVEKVLGT